VSAARLLVPAVVALVLAMAWSASRGAPRIAPWGPTVHAVPAGAQGLERPALFGPYDEVWRVPTSRKIIALTFDDGPFPFYTPVLLHVLARSHVPATFFVVGRNAQEFPELVQRIVASGDEIANHTFNHVFLTRLSDAQIEEQILADGTLLEHFTGKPCTLFRPPHGRYDRRVVSIARDLGYTTVFWSAAANDTRNVTPRIIVRRILHEAGPGGIILLHNGRYATIEALPVIIDRLRAAGYRFVTVSELLAEAQAR
jgi:peptidoglycan/xylan/chitin deacetylase (PgdA/CDA1 family)